MTIHLGYIAASSTLYIPFNTFDSNGASITITGLATSDIQIYKDGSTTQRSSTNGFTLLDTDGIDFDSLTGIHGFSIDLSDNSDAGFYAAGHSYWVVIASVTCDTRTVNFVAATFFIGPVTANVTQLLGTAWLTPGTAGTPDVNVKLWNALTTVALPLVPTTAGRTLDCSAGGEAGVDWANVGSPTTAVDLSGTTIKTTQKVDVDTIKTNPVVNGGTITFPTTATLASTTNITAGTIATVTNLTNAPTAGDLTAAMKTSVTTAATAATPVAASVTGAVGSVTGLTAATVHSDLDDIQARLPAALTADGNIKADSLRISNSAEAADRLERTTLAIVTVACDAGSTTTSVVGLTLSPVSAVNDQFNGQIMSFDKDTTTANLRGQKTEVTDYVHATKTFTVTALTDAPASGDTFTLT